MTWRPEQSEEKAMNQRVVLAVGLAKYNSGALLLRDGKESCGCDRLRRCCCCSSMISKSITSRKNITHPSGLYGKWFNLTYLLKAADQMVLKEAHTAFKCRHRVRLLSCNSLPSLNKTHIWLRSDVFPMQITWRHLHTAGRFCLMQKQAEQVNIQHVAWFNRIFWCLDWLGD